MVSKTVKTLLVVLCISMIFSSCKNSEANSTLFSEKDFEKDFGYANNYIQGEDLAIASEGLTWPEDQALPSFAPVCENLDAIKVGALSSDIQLTLATLQGIVNRTQPRIFLINQNAAEGGETWLKTLDINYTVEKNYKNLIEKYKSEVKGLVVYDSKTSLKDTKNLATTIAGLYDYLAVSPKVAETLTQDPFNFEIKVDLRENNFTDKYDIYQYAYEELWPQCEKRLVIGLDPDINFFIRDLAVAAKCIVFYLDAEDTKDKAMIDKFLGEADKISYYLGWWPNETPGVIVSATNGSVTVAADFFENYSVYAGMSRDITIPTTPKLPELENKLYISLMLSDGDNIQYCQHSLKTETLWESEDRGSIPIGWTASPLLLDAAPQILNYYYKTATDNDQLIIGPSGAGYTQLELWTDDYYMDRYARMTENYLRKTAFNYITVWRKLPEAQAQSLAAYAPSLVGVSVQEKSKYGEENIRVFDNKLSSILVTPNYSHEDQEESLIMNAIDEYMESWQGDSAGFLSAQAVAWEVGPSGLKELAEEVLQKYPDKVVFVRPDHLAMLYNKANSLAYNITLEEGVEIEVSGTDEGEEGLAYKPEQLIDNSFSRDKGWKYTSEDGVSYIKIDLKKEFYINRYVIYHAGSAGYDKSMNTEKFKIEYSLDGKNWTIADAEKSNKADITDKYIEPFKARYVRLVIADPGSDNSARIQDIVLYGNENQLEKQTFTDSETPEKPEPIYENLALKANVTASGYYKDSEKPEFAIDGNLTTKWCSVEPDENGQHWIQLNFDEEITFDSYKLINAGIYKDRIDHNTVAWEVLYLRGEEWVKLDEVKDNYDLIYTYTGGEKITSKAIRLVVKDPGRFITDQGTEDPAVRLPEFQIECRT